MNKNIWQHASLSLISFFFVLATPAFAAFFPLEITNIKPAGAGNPAIPSTNRIFRAYPGIEYNIRAAVIGGLYPYTYSLSNAPSGMTINSATGEISWPSPQANSGTITLTVGDSENTTVSTTWSITVTSSTDDFIFVNPAYSGTQTGSITQPYSSLANMLNAESSTSKIVYFRAGNYPMVDHNSGAEYVMNIDSSPKTWLGYPGESVTLQGNGTGVNAYRIVSMTASPIYFDRLAIKAGVEYTLFLANSHYQTIRRCIFDGLTTLTAVNENQGMIYMPNGDGVRDYLVVQDNEFTDFVGGQAIGSLYRTNKALIENNYTHDGGQAGLHGFCTPIGIKTSNTYYTIRGNKIIMPADATTFEIYNELTDQDYGEFAFNYISKLGGGDDSALVFFYPETVLLRRNTFNGNISFYAGLSDGPYVFENNVLAGSLITPTYVTQTDNLVGDYDSGIFGTDGSLAVGYTEYVGSRGWQFSDGSTPMSPGAPATPQYHNRGSRLN